MPPSFGIPPKLFNYNRIIVKIKATVKVTHATVYRRVVPVQVTSARSEIDSLGCHAFFASVSLFLYLFSSNLTQDLPTLPVRHRPQSMLPQKEMKAVPVHRTTPIHARNVVISPVDRSVYGFH